MARRVRVDRYFIQICPHDSAPFGDLCAAYAQAAEAEGFKPLTFYLSSPTGEADSRAEYLGARRVKAAMWLGYKLADRLPRLRFEEQVAAVLCHRYRALKVGIWSGLPKDRMVCLAHEYGLLGSKRRLWVRENLGAEVHFAGVSNDVAEELAQVTGQFMVLPNIVTPVEVLSRCEARAALGIREDARVVGVVGRLHYKKRPDLAIAAVRTFRERAPDVELVFVGDGDRALVSPDESWVHVAGQKPHASTLMSAFDVVLHTGNVESFGMVILEAMAAGVPVAVGQFPGPQYVLGDHGFYAPQDTPAGYADALIRAFDTDLEQWRESAGRRVAERFSLQATQGRVSELVRFLATQPHAEV